MSIERDEDGAPRAPLHGPALVPPLGRILGQQDLAGLEYALDIAHESYGSATTSL